MSGSDVLIQPEEVGGIIFGLDPDQLLIRLGSDTIAHDLGIAIVPQKIEIEPVAKIASKSLALAALMLKWHMPFLRGSVAMHQRMVFPAASE